MTTTDVDWRDVLSRLRDARSRRRDEEGEDEEGPAHDATTSEDDVDEDDDDFLPYLPLAAREVDGYVSALSDDDGGGGAAVSLVPNVRRCLRVTQNLLSPRHQPRHQIGGGDGDGDGDGDRPVPPSAAQLAAVRGGLHLSLAWLLSSSSDEVDATCRTTAARTLCNLVTANVESASIVAVDVPLSPVSQPTDHGSDAAVVVDDDVDTGAGKHRPRCSRPCSWVDMIASPARRGERDAVAAVVASLHNCLASLDDDDDDGPPPVPPDGGRHEAGLEAGADGVSDAELHRAEDDSVASPRPPPSSIGGREFAADVSGDRLLVCNLLRNILPVTAASASSPSKSTDGGGVDEDHDHADGATEWISLLLTRLVRMGELPALYRSAGGGRDGGGPRPEDDEDSLVTPEQVVLLSCVSNAAGETGGGSSVVVPIEDAATMEFLASILSSTGCSEESSSKREERYPGEDECRASVRSYVADILASSLLPRDDDHQSSSTTQRRRRLLADLGGGGPSRCRLIERASLELGAAVDRVHRSNFGRGSRDVTVPELEGRLIKSLVRLIGNLCHRCPENRDLLREVEVPFLPGVGGAVGEEPGGCYSAHAVRDDGDGAVRDDDGSPSDGGGGTEAKALTPHGNGSGRRSGLHVLLSCTSLCHGCFGLREWAVVAIRDALEDNPANQKVLEELSPRAVATSPDELRDLGIDLELDEGGRVRVKNRTRRDGG